jgi:serine/threonine protein kinase
LDPAPERGAFRPLAAALYVARELARALEYCHALRDSDGQPMNIIHRDVSPHNLLLGRDGSVKLTDFGLAEVNVVADREMMGGKLGYLAPEIVNRGHIGPGTDVFALGIVLWEMLAGRPLFLGDTDSVTVQNVARCEIPSLHDFNPAVPASVDMLLSRVLIADPAQRLSASIVTGALDRALQDASVGPKDVSLMVGMHLARKRRVEKTDDMAAIGLALLEQELEEFAAQAEGDAPLDPMAFASESEAASSGLRDRPLPEFDE